MGRSTTGWYVAGHQDMAVAAAELSFTVPVHAIQLALKIKQKERAE